MSALKVLYEVDTAELRKLVAEMKSHIKRTNSNHRDGRGSFISKQLEDNLIKSLEEIHYKMNYDIATEYKQGK